MTHELKDIDYRTFRVYGRKSPVSIDEIVGKFRGRTYKIDKDKVDKKSGCYTFLLANPNLVLRTNNHPEEIVDKIQLCFHPEEVGYTVEALCYLTYVEGAKIIKDKSRFITKLRKEHDEVKFGKGVQKTLIRTLEEQ